MYAFRITLMFGDSVIIRERRKINEWQTFPFYRAISVVHRSCFVSVCVCCCTHECMHSKLGFVQFITNSADRDLQGKRLCVHGRNINKTVPARRWPAALKISAHSHEAAPRLTHTQTQNGQQCVHRYQFSIQTHKAFPLQLAVLINTSCGEKE